MRTHKPFDWAVVARNAESRSVLRLESGLKFEPLLFAAGPGKSAASRAIARCGRTVRAATLRRAPRGAFRASPEVTEQPSPLLSGLRCITAVLLNAAIDSRGHGDASAVALHERTEKIPQSE
jgi:hypothetical protein